MQKLLVLLVFAIKTLSDRYPVVSFHYIFGRLSLLKSSRIGEKEKNKKEVAKKETNSTRIFVRTTYVVRSIAMLLIFQVPFVFFQDIVGRCAFGFPQI